MLSGIKKLTKVWSSIFTLFLNNITAWNNNYNQSPFILYSIFMDFSSISIFNPYDSFIFASFLPPCICEGSYWGDRAVHTRVSFRCRERLLQSVTSTLTWPSRDSDCFSNWWEAPTPRSLPTCTCHLMARECHRCVSSTKAGACSETWESLSRLD